MLKWLTDWLTGKTPDTNDIQVNPFPTTEKAPASTQVVDTPVAKTKAAAKKTAKPKAEKKPAKAKAEKKPAKTKKA